MKTIDLSQTLFDSMPVYPGDPEVFIKQIHHLETEGWNLTNITFTSHIGTHLNVPLHMVENGKTLDDFPLESFFGECKKYTHGMQFNKDEGVIFTDHNIDKDIMEKLISSPPKFVGLSEKFEFDIEIEKKLLEHGIISYENLANTEQLPDKFKFYGLPLNIQKCDGSPVRAYAEIGHIDNFFV